MIFDFVEATENLLYVYIKILIRGDDLYVENISIRSISTVIMNLTFNSQGYSEKYTVRIRQEIVPCL